MQVTVASRVGYPRAMKVDRAVLGAAALLAVFGGPWFVRQIRSLPQPSHLAARSDQRIVTLEVTGMRSESCERAISDSLKTVAGVTATEVRLGMSRAYVVAARQVADSSLVAAVARAGAQYRAAVVAK